MKNTELISTSSKRLHNSVILEGLVVLKQKERPDMKIVSIKQEWLHYFHYHNVIIFWISQRTDFFNCIHIRKIKYLS